MVVLQLDGTIVEGNLKPSSDTPTHLVLYHAFDGVGGIVHTHSTWATVRAQAAMGIPAYGTTHADYFHGEIPCTRDMRSEEITGDYEAQTGEVIVETFQRLRVDPLSVPSVLVRSHGPFSWGRDAAEAVHNAVVLEQVAHMAHQTEVAGAAKAAGWSAPMPQALLDKHFLRKHGPGAYYGQ
jgi:L-ribulose-5-phosphate 4-epimerase